ncbi:ribonuclease P protein component 4, partial [Candidatus Bathyarchaeota archaeon]|nr:ribonuclease P protein component 4 [Candidatus Bathyarchaeota archaeon]
KTNPMRAQHYFKRARELGMRYKIRFPLQFRQLICRSCKQLIVPGINSRIRLQRRPEPHKAITCLECGGIRRIPLRSGRKDVDKTST